MTTDTPRETGLIGLVAGASLGVYDRTTTPERLMAKILPDGAYVSDSLKPYTAEGYRSARAAFLGTASAVARLPAPDARK